MLYGAGEGQPLAAARATACIGLSMYIRRERHSRSISKAQSVTIVTNDNNYK